MSNLLATVTKIKTQDALTLVDFDYMGVTLRMMSLELRGDIAAGCKVYLVLKPTSVAIGKNLSGILSYSNRFDAVVEKIDRGKLLCSITLRFKDSLIESIITKESFLRLQIKEGDTVTALIKASEISIKEISDD
jgi:molybdopterin-binding protein